MIGSSVLRSRGSSPRMRGAQSISESGQLHKRIIPAYAGSTEDLRWGIKGEWDHPRVCGEHFHRCCTCYHCWGSSPRMRGARPQGSGKTLSAGIIPAYAGSTRPARRSSPGSGDHPRVCGEHLLFARCVKPVVGSSPRMRGALTKWDVLRLQREIIPAYAGSTGRMYIGR